MRTIFVLTCVLICATLSACTNVVMSGAQLVYNRHNLQKKFNDQYITRTAFRKLKIEDDRFSNANIVIATFNKEVLLVGEVPEPRQRFLAAEIVKKIAGVKNVHNLLTIESPSSTLTRLSDTWITGKLKAKLLASNDVEDSQIKVVTENGIVYLMGILTPKQALAAVDVARNTDGVIKVVKVFSYVTITKQLPAINYSS